MKLDILGHRYCTYESENYHIYKRGEHAIVTGNAGIYRNSLKYFLVLEGDLGKAYLSTKEKPRSLPVSGFIVNKTTKILNSKYYGQAGTKICLIEIKGWQFVISMDYLKPKRRTKMNEIIIERFEKTEEAVLVEKWFGEEFNKPIFKLLLKGKEKEIVQEAYRLEKEEKASETKQ